MSSTAMPRAVLSVRVQELILPVGVIAGVLVILVPMPTPVMDMLLAANIPWPSSSC